MRGSARGSSPPTGSLTRSRGDLTRYVQYTYAPVMTAGVTIVMYHYIRDFARTRYPRIKGLDVAGFRRQLDHIGANHSIVRMEDVIDAALSGAELPPNAALLTFDDGYAEHYATVFPILHERGLQGAFFPPVATVEEGRLLDVNRVHFVLATAPSSAELAAAIDDEVQSAGDDDLRAVAEYRTEWAHPNRWDDADTIYVKRMLQTALPPHVRERVARTLFRRYVSVDETAFAAELYLTVDQARVMVDAGMHFGSHGVSHQWLNRVDAEIQTSEILGSIEFLTRLGMPTQRQWTMCYPYGGWNQELVDLLRRHQCSLGFTTELAKAELGQHDPLLLPRFDTNDFPQ